VNYNSKNLKDKRMASFFVVRASFKGKVVIELGRKGS